MLQQGGHTKLAVRENHPQAAQILIAHGATVTDQEIQFALDANFKELHDILVADKSATSVTTQSLKVVQNFAGRFYKPKTVVKDIAEDSVVLRSGTSK